MPEPKRTSTTKGQEDLGAALQGLATSLGAQELFPKASPLGVAGCVGGASSPEASSAAQATVTSISTGGAKGAAEPAGASTQGLGASLGACQPPRHGQKAHLLSLQRLNDACRCFCTLSGQSLALVRLIKMPKTGAKEHKPQTI